MVLLVTPMESTQRKNAATKPSTDIKANVDADEVTAAFVLAGALALPEELVLELVVPLDPDPAMTSPVVFALRKACAGKLARIISSALKSCPRPCVPSHVEEDQSAPQAVPLLPPEH